jgi:FixJ family two-component response regulator
MPEMCGPELVRNIRRICPDTAVVLMSENIGSEELPEHAVFIGKPFQLADMYSTVKRALFRL